MLLGDVYFEMFTVRLFTTWKKLTEFGWECQQDWLRIMVRIDYYLKGCMVEQKCKNNKEVLHSPNFSGIGITEVERILPQQNFNFSKS